MADQQSTDASPLLSDDERLLRRVLSPELDVVALARSEATSPAELASWAGRVTTDELLSALRRLQDSHTQLMIARFRMTAVARLVDLITDETLQDRMPETVRRACHDLLSSDLMKQHRDRTTRGVLPDESPPLPAFAEDALFEALAEMGAEASDDASR